MHPVPFDASFSYIRIRSLFRLLAFYRTSELRTFLLLPFGKLQFVRLPLMIGTMLPLNVTFTSTKLIVKIDHQHFCFVSFLQPFCNLEP